MSNDPARLGRDARDADEPERSSPAGSFAHRWLEEAGVPQATIGALLKRASDRARRYPLPIWWFHVVVTWLANWVGPLLLLGCFRRACGLDTPRFLQLLDRFQASRSPLVRALALLAIAPLFEVAYGEPAPAPVAHPLRGPGGTPTRSATGDSFDVVIVGSGAGGAPAAWWLAARGLRVALVERGTLVEARSASDAIETYYVNQGLVGSMLGGLTLVVAGNAVGGSTAINSGTCLRPPAERLREWDRSLGTSFAAGDLDPWLDEAERKIGVTVPDRALMSRSSQLFEKGLAHLGLGESHLLPRSAPGCVGAGRCCFGCPTGAKMSTDRAFLPDAVASGLQLFEGHEAVTISEQARSVQVIARGRDGTSRKLEARHLVLAAGALFTPGLIRRNRLGDRWSRAGDCFKTHPATKAFAHFPGLPPMTCEGVPQGLGYRDPGMERVSFEGIHTPPSVSASLLAFTGSRMRWWMDRVHDLACFGLMIRDRNTGRVREIAGIPVILYRLHPDDASEMGRALLLMARVFFAAGAERVFLPVVGVPNEFAQERELSQICPDDFTPRNLAVAGFHPQGTAAMGRLVDTRLGLSGCDRIWVCDGSVLPDSPGVNPQITIMALSLRLADHLVAAGS
ncbi:MAG: GMC family oxidoreductase [Candidatus Riflebacteria bacterium]|nr:GMC family oxidoreductase [Candidatus Riflebacteria bacterium]